MGSVILFSTQTTAAEEDHPAQDRRVEGNPLRTTRNHFTNESGEIFSGVWASEKGSWNIVMGPREDEFFQVLEGRCRLVSETGEVAEAGPGEALIIPAGFKGRYEVLEAMKKNYVIIDRKA